MLTLCLYGCLAVIKLCLCAVLDLLKFTGFLHPLIHLGFGVEFDQPAIVAEALAQAAVVSRIFQFPFHAATDWLRAAKASSVIFRSIQKIFLQIAHGGNSY